MAATLLAASLALSLATSWVVVVVAEPPSIAPASAPPSVMSLRAQAALRGGLTAAGQTLLPDAAAHNLARIADATTGACEVECAQKMAQQAAPGRLLLARLAIVGDRFALRVEAGAQKSSARGVLHDLESAATAAANEVARPEASVLVEGSAHGATLFIDGVPSAPNVKGVLPAAPGRRVVRVGDGHGVGAMRLVDVLPGQITTVSFPSGSDGARRTPVAVVAGGALADPGGPRAGASPQTTRERSARTATPTSGRPWTRSPWTWAAAGVAVLAGGAAAAYAADSSGGSGGATESITTVEIDE